jgi:hypothetical protein
MKIFYHEGYRSGGPSWDKIMENLPINEERQG